MVGVMNDGHTCKYFKAGEIVLDNCDGTLATLKTYLQQPENYQFVRI